MRVGRLALPPNAPQTCTHTPPVNFTYALTFLYIFFNTSPTSELTIADLPMLPELPNVTYTDKRFVVVNELET